MANSGEWTCSLLVFKSIAPQVGFPPLAAPRPTDPPDDGKANYRNDAVRAGNVTVEMKTTALPSNFSAVMPR